MLNLLSGKSEIKGSLQSCSCSEGNTECFNQQSLARIPGGELSHWMLPVHPLHQQECIPAAPDAGPGPTELKSIQSRVQGRLWSALVTLRRSVAPRSPSQPVT